MRVLCRVGRRSTTGACPDIARTRLGYSLFALAIEAACARVTCAAKLG